ncbi:MAG TPA: hypothetical protein DEB40_11595, partial [Elusimicrobia bacterium]|nr:hypothetical protein [Elusimicrobiota bacterium]
TAFAAPYVYSLDTSALALGAHTLMVKAYDTAGNSAAQSVTVNVVSASKSRGPKKETKAKNSFLSPRNATMTFGEAATKVDIFDSNGRKVYSAASNGTAPITWTGREGGKMVESGAYVAKITDSSGNIIHQTVIVVK